MNDLTHLRFVELICITWNHKVSLKFENCIKQFCIYVKCMKRHIHYTFGIFSLKVQQKMFSTLFW